MMRALVAPMLLILAVGCGSDPVPVVVSEGPADDVGWVDGMDVVVVGDSTFVVTGAPGDGCVDLDGACVSIGEAKAKHCDDPDAQADVVVVDGKVIEVVCYPPRASGVAVEEVTEVAEGTAAVPQNAGKTVVTFDPATDGKPFEGNLRLDAESLVLIGNGFDKTIIDGNLVIASNNARIRGVTVTGNVTFEKNSNNASIAFCEVQGNLEIHSNDVSVLALHVFGNVVSKGNNVTLVSVGVGGEFKVNDSVVCVDNFAFADDNEDFDVVPGEVGEALACEAK